MAKKLDHTEAVEHLSRVDRKLARIIAKAGAVRAAARKNAEHV